MMTPKPDMTLLPPDALLAMADVMTRADTPEKHKDAKWKRMTPEEHIAAALRHTFAWLGGEKVDPELGTSHLANASVRMSMALALALAPLAHSTSLRSPLRADALRDPLRGSAPATTDTTYTTQHWWLYQDEAGWEGNHNAPAKTLDDFTPDQWDTAADRSKDIWAETKV